MDYAPPTLTRATVAKELAFLAEAGAHAIGMRHLLRKALAEADKAFGPDWEVELQRIPEAFSPETALLLLCPDYWEADLFGSAFSWWLLGQCKVELDAIFARDGELSAPLLGAAVAIGSAISMQEGVDLGANSPEQACALAVVAAASFQGVVEGWEARIRDKMRAMLADWEPMFAELAELRARKTPEVIADATAYKAYHRDFNAAYRKWSDLRDAIKQEVWLG